MVSGLRNSISLRRSSLQRILKPMAPATPCVAIGEDQSWLYFIWDLLGGEHVHMACFTDPEDGLEYATDHLALIVLLDPATPGLDAWEMLGRIFRQSATTQMVIVAGYQSGNTAILATRTRSAEYTSSFVHLRDIQEHISSWFKRLDPEVLQ